MRHCPICQSEFQDWVKTCLDCGNFLEDGPFSDTEEDESPAGETLESAEIDESEEDVDKFVDEVIEAGDFFDPAKPDEYADEESPAVDPRAALTSVDNCMTVDAVERVSSLLRKSGIKVYLLKKASIFQNFFVLMVETADAEKALQIIEETDHGQLVPIEPGVEDPELKGAPVINLDLEKPKTEIIQPVAEETEDKPVRCPGCGSTDIKFKTSLFSSKVRLTCRVCCQQWQE